MIGPLGLARLGWRTYRLAVGSMAGYLGLLTVAAWCRHGRRHGRRRPIVDVSVTKRFAVLIPAHNEHRLIADTVSSVRASRYPADRFDIHVVCDNCSDDTAAIATAAGAEAHERFVPERPGKGPALQWLLARLAARGADYDRFVFVDADTLVDRDFLAVAATYDAPVVQGHYGVRDPEVSPVVAYRAATMALRNHLRPLGRRALGGTAGLYGNGMVIAPEVLERRAWSDHLVEDVELSLELLLDGTLVEFAPDAKVVAEMPTSNDAAESQHARWEQGRRDLAVRFTPRLVVAALRGRRGVARRAYLDAVADLVVPPLSVVGVAGCGWLSVATLRRVFCRRGSADLLCAALAVAILPFSLLSALRMIAAPAAVYRSLAELPRMVVWKLRLLGGVVGRGEAEWQRTARNAD